MTICRKTLNGHNFLRGYRLGRSAARAGGFAPQQNRTSAALAFAAAVLGPGETYPVTQDREQRLAGRTFGLVFNSVHNQGDGLACSTAVNFIPIILTLAASPSASKRHFIWALTFIVITALGISRLHNS